MRILVVGGGGREHALCWKIRQSEQVKELFCIPGNAGTRSLARSVPELAGANVNTLALWAVQEHIDLTVVGPEAPLAEGIVDVFAEHGLKIFGPTKAAAQLESSKSFAKEVMLKAGVRTAKGEVFADYEAAKAYVRSHGAPLVVKVDGLAAGKGVVVADSEEEALAALERFMVSETLGTGASRVVIEEKLVGREASVIAIVDDQTVLPLVVSQDYKRLQDGDSGPNTGGMGAISPTPVLADKRVQQLVGEIFLPVLAEMRARRIPYRGFLYAGVLVEASGAVNVLEFNCRLGDPETQVILLRLQSDLVAALEAGIHNRLASAELKWSMKPAACVVASSAGYPGKVEEGKEIFGLFKGDEELQIFHAGTRMADENSKAVLTKGGRVLCVSALGTSLDNAVERAYDSLAKISFEGMHIRKDIGRVVS